MVVVGVGVVDLGMRKNTLKMGWPASKVMSWASGSTRLSWASKLIHCRVSKSLKMTKPPFRMYARRLAACASVMIQNPGSHIMAMGCLNSSGSSRGSVRLPSVRALTAVYSPTTDIRLASAPGKLVGPEVDAHAFRPRPVGAPRPAQAHEGQAAVVGQVGPSPEAVAAESELRGHGGDAAQGHDRNHRRRQHSALRHAASIPPQPACGADPSIAPSRPPAAPGCGRSRECAAGRGCPRGRRTRTWGLRWRPSESRRSRAAPRWRGRRR